MAIDVRNIRVVEDRDGWQVSATNCGVNYMQYYSRYPNRLPNALSDEDAVRKFKLYCVGVQKLRGK